MKLLLLTSLAVGITACATLTGPAETHLVGVTHFYGEPVEISVPAAATAGVPFEVSVRTYGGGCIRKNGTQAVIAGQTVDVTPYDVHSGGDICTDELRLFVHRAAFSIESAGTAEVRFHGRALPGDTAVVVTREVVVN